MLLKNHKTMGIWNFLYCGYCILRSMFSTLECNLLSFTAQDYFQKTKKYDKYIIIISNCSPSPVKTLCTVLRYPWTQRHKFYKQTSFKPAIQRFCWLFVGQCWNDFTICWTSVKQLSAKAPLSSLQQPKMIYKL